MFCRCIATGLLDTDLDRMDFTKPDNHWIAKKYDKRKTNKGAEKRISRTWQFKRKMILEVEKMATIHPEEADQATSSPGFGCRIRTEPVSDPNPNPRMPIRSESEPGGAGTDPNPNLECRNRYESEPRVPKPIRIRTREKNRIRTPNPDPNPAKRESSATRDLIDTCMASCQ